MEESTERFLAVTVIGITIVLIAWAIAWGMTIEEREAMKYGYDVINVPMQQETTNYIKKDK